MTSEVKVYSEEEVSQHDKPEDCWLIIGNESNGGCKVVDITKYLNDHPGGPEIMLEYAGKNADDMFEDIGHSTEARQILKKYIIGEVKVDPNTITNKKAKKVAEALSKKQGGLNPLAVLVLLIAVAAGIYFSQLKK